VPEVETMIFDIPIERGKIREFARAAQSEDPCYQGESAIVPATFLTTARLLWRSPTDPSQAEIAGFDRRRVLHGAEEFVFHGELPHAGEVLTVETKLGDTYEKAGKRGGAMRFAVIVSEFRNAAGECVAEQRSTLIEMEPTS
jgi:hypothetical protein